MRYSKWPRYSVDSKRPRLLHMDITLYTKCIRHIASRLIASDTLWMPTFSNNNKLVFYIFEPNFRKFILQTQHTNYSVDNKKQNTLSTAKHCRFMKKFPCHMIFLKSMTVSYYLY